MQTSHSNKSALLRQGVTVIVGLAVLTVVEYFASRVPDSGMPLLALIALAKAALIGLYFMHAGKLFQSDQGED